MNIIQIGGLKGIQEEGSSGDRVGGTGVTPEKQSAVSEYDGREAGLAVQPPQCADLAPNTEGSSRGFSSSLARGTACAPRQAEGSAVGVR